MTVDNTTGQLATDGLRIGVDGTNSDVIFNQQENANVRILSGDNSGGGERMRITSISTPGTINPGNLANSRITRVSISHDRSNPVTKPLSLLHLGYNTGGQSATGASLDGWRSWMDIGTFTSNGTDNVFLGLKQEGNKGRQV